MSETIEDIVREMREQRQFLGAELCARADRIEAAAKEMRDDNAKLKKERAYLRELLHSAECENSFLRERYERCAKALEPVLAVIPSAWATTNRFSLGEYRTPVYDGKWCEAAIIESQRIYNEGASK